MLLLDVGFHRHRPWLSAAGLAVPVTRAVVLGVAWMATFTPITAF